MSALLWLRRDLRRDDLPALVSASADGGREVLPVFVVEPGLWEGAGRMRRTWVAASVRAAARAYEDRLLVLAGDPGDLLARLARAADADEVHVSRETTPYGRRRDERARRALAESSVAWVETGSPYAVGPGLVTKDDGDPYRVFTPFSKAWREHGWPDPAAEPEGVRLHPLAGADHLDDLTQLDAELGVAARAGQQALAAVLDGDLSELPERSELPEAGPEAALAAWQSFRDGALGDYSQERNRPDTDSTSRLSPYLKVGAIHPRTILADCDERRRGVTTFVNELAWREFYADVLWHAPKSAWTDLRESLSSMRYDDAEDNDAVPAWRQGRTGYPIVDAGMRQLLATGWMHNRVRMITASFLTKDLHIWWPVGARHFLAHLIDGDIASNNHGWQWVAGTGTDAAPYFRVFNPITQGQRFDPDGAYVRRWVPELAHLPGAAAHTPWEHEQGYAHDYPRRIVDHAAERVEALARYEAARA